MASNEEPTLDTSKIASNPDAKTDKPTSLLYRAELALRIVLITTTAVAVLLMVTSKQTVVIDNPFTPLPFVTYAKFNYSPALVYFVVANSVVCVYTVLTTCTSALSLHKPSLATKLLLLSAVFDALMVGVVASATGAGASIAYLGIRGNSQVGWEKVCDIYGKFCRYIGTSIIVSLVSSIILVLLVLTSTYSLYHRTH